MSGGAGRPAPAAAGAPSAAPEDGLQRVDHEPMRGGGAPDGADPPLGSTLAAPVAPPEDGLQRVDPAPMRGGGAPIGADPPLGSTLAAAVAPPEDGLQRVDPAPVRGGGAPDGAEPPLGSTLGSALAAPAAPPEGGLQRVDPAPMRRGGAPDGAVRRGRRGAALQAGPGTPAPAQDGVQDVDQGPEGVPAGGGQAPRRDYADRVPFPEVVTLRPIAVMRSPFRERHGTPRQGVVDDQPLPPTEGEVELLDGIPVEALADLAGFARVWLLSWMHLNNPAWSPMVRPPRGGQRRGVFATRSPHRPNPIALSCVALVAVEGRRLRVSGHDLIDGTPILDIKPYLPFADAFPGAAAGWVDALPRGADGRPLGPRLKRP
jgi:tRNA-Thr(GGU) m(6)t(6)A37 methyltransferase TsaA